MAKQSSSDSRNPGAGVQSGLSSREPLKNVEGTLSKTLDKETAKQGPHAETTAEGPFKLK